MHSFAFELGYWLYDGSSGKNVISVQNLLIRMTQNTIFCVILVLKEDLLPVYGILELTLFMTSFVFFKAA